MSFSRRGRGIYGTRVNFEEETLYHTHIIILYTVYIIMIYCIMSLSLFGFVEGTYVIYV